jgi:hypothetical protein
MSRGREPGDAGRINYNFLGVTLRSLKKVLLEMTSECRSFINC